MNKKLKPKKVKVLQRKPANDDPAREKLSQFTQSQIDAYKARSIAIFTSKPQ